MVGAKREAVFQPSVVPRGQSDFREGRCHLTPTSRHAPGQQ